MDQPLANPPVFVGIDVAKDRLDVHVLPMGHAARWRAMARAWPA
jgi:hypothetical protein